MDSPDQGVRGIKAELVTTPEGKICIEVPKIGASFEGMLQNGTITGDFIQHGYRFPLTLTPGAKKLNRPQTPVGPFPYSTEDVSFRNGDAVLKGTLTMPLHCNKATPVVLLVTGSGLQNRDEEIFEHKPFAVIADAFARAGIATLRYDDRGFGDSTGDIINCTTEDLKNDALAGVKFLRERFDRVGVAGHSEGGTIAIMLAAEKATDFIVTLAGGVVPMKQTLLYQNEYELGKLQFSKEDVRSYCDALGLAFDAIAKGEHPRSIDDSTLPESLKQNYKAAVMQCNTRYMRYFLGLDVRTLLRQIDCPVLALNGCLDRQVDSKANLGELKRSLKTQNATIVEMENLNHMFQHCKTGDASEYKDIEETFAPEALEKMTSWILKLGF